MSVPFKCRGWLTFDISRLFTYLLRKRYRSPVQIYVDILLWEHSPNTRDIKQTEITCYANLYLFLLQDLTRNPGYGVAQFQ